MVQCLKCQRNKTESLFPTGLLQPLLVPERIWDDISMDFIEGLPKSRGFDLIIVVVDRLSKYSHFITLTHPFFDEASGRSVYQKGGLPSWVSQINSVR